MSARIPVGLLGSAAVLLAVLSTTGCNPPPHSTPADKEEEYLKQKASAVLDGLLVGDFVGVQGAMTEKMLKGLNPGGDHVSVPNWITSWNSRKLYNSYTIDKVAFSPSKDEAVISGSLKGKDDAVNATFTMTLVKEKDKYMLDACSHKER